MFWGVDRDKTGRIGFFGSSGGTSGFGLQTGTVPTRSGRLASMRLHGALLRKPRNSILLASSNFILLHPGTQHPSSHAADRQAYAYMYAPGSNKPSWPGWLTEKILNKKKKKKKKKEAHLAAMSKKALRVLCQVLGTRFQPSKKRNRAQRVCTRSD